MTTTSWLDEGLELLAEQGAPALRIEALTRRLGVTKGSFYHHFVDLADYRRALLGHYQELCTTRLIAANAALEGSSALDRLRALAATVLAEEAHHRGLEVALRAWAAQDDDARATLQHVDGFRLGYLDELAGQVLGDPVAAHDLARTAYYLLVGSQGTVPPGSLEELGRLWARLLAPLAEPAPASGADR